MTVAMVQLTIVNFVVPFLIMLSGKPQRSLSRAQLVRWILPLALLKTFASISSHVSLLKVPVAYSHTIKALMPIFAVLLSRLLLGTRHSRLTYWSLVPIVLGVLVASMTELAFDLVGLVAALLSCLAFSLQSILSKQALSKYNLDKYTILLLVSRTSLALLAPVWLCGPWSRWGRGATGRLTAVSRARQVHGCAAAVDGRGDGRAGRAPARVAGPAAAAGGHGQHGPVHRRL